MDNKESGRSWFLLTLFLSALLLVPTLWFGFGADQGLHSYGAWVWRKFALAPYAGTFDHNFPGIFLICYLIQAVLGESVTAFRIFDLLWQVLTALMIYLVSCHAFQNRLSGFFSAIFYSIYYLGLGPWDTGHPDTFLLGFYLVSFWFLLKSDNRPARIAFGLAGWFLGTALVVKPIAIIPGLIFLLFPASSKIKSRFPDILCFSGSFIIPLLLFLIYYWRIGHLRELFQALFSFNYRVYSGALVIDTPAMLKGIFLLKSLASSPAIILGGFLYFIFKPGDNQPTRINPVWLWRLLSGIYLGYLMQGKFYPYQQAPVLGFLCLFAGAGWARVTEKIEIKVRTGIIHFAFALILILLSLFSLRAEYLTMLAHSLRHSPGQSRELYPFFKVCAQSAEYLKAHTGPEDKIQVWGGEALINYLAQRRAPSRFPSTLSLIFRPGPDLRSPLQKEFARELLNSLQADPPEYFLAEIMSHPGYGIPSDKQILIEDYPELWRFISRNYFLEHRIGFVECWRIKVRGKAL